LRIGSRRSRIVAAVVGGGILCGAAAVLIFLLLTDLGRARWYLNTCSYVYTAATGSGAPPPSGFTGTWRQWWINGMLMAEFEVRDGVPHGRHVSWTDDGTKSSEGLYAAGKKTGQWIHYHSNGCKYAELSYKEGMMHGIKKVWDRCGRVEEFVWMYNGWRVISLDTAGIPADFTGIWRRVGLEGGPEEIEIHNGRMDGCFSSWYKNGHRFAEGHLRDGVPDGILVRWRADGTKKAEASYVNGMQHGRETTWDARGRLIESRWWYEGRAVSEEQFRELSARTGQPATGAAD